MRKNLPNIIFYSLQKESVIFCLRVIASCMSIMFSIETMLEKALSGTLPVLSKKIRKVSTAILACLVMTFAGLLIPSSSSSSSKGASTSCVIESTISVSVNILVTATPSSTSTKSFNFSPIVKQDKKTSSYRGNFT
ncbi:hypothetical protein HHI36_014072 [Cryptolaemus montrouzieri]|uniref:Uncharacterized protein n=1 Tax=Cryptolaemus montrouzieri TaxID=559131 RepID=A0ABD2N2A8_9CUCU